MNIELQIEHLVLNGLPMAEHHLPELQAALQDTLGRLLSKGDLTQNKDFSPAPNDLTRGHMKWEPHSSPQQLGVELAGAVYSLLGSSRGGKS